MFLGSLYSILCREILITCGFGLMIPRSYQGIRFDGKYNGLIVDFGDELSLASIRNTKSVLELGCSVINRPKRQ